MWKPAECKTTSLEVAASLREDGWIFEEKHDGLRAVCEVRAGGNRVTGRNGTDISKPQVGHLLGVDFGAELAGSVFDGELMPDGSYIIFDVLVHCGRDVRGERLAVRREFMAGDLPLGVRWIQQHDTFAGVGNFVEGVVVKDMRSKYGFGWFKAKRVDTDDVLVRSVADGVADVGCGKVCGVPESVRVGDCIEVEFFARTKAGKLRSGRYLRTRDDKTSGKHDDEHGGLQPCASSRR